MQLASLLFCMVAALPRPVPTVNGTWTLDRIKSDFGAADTPTKFDVLLDQAGDRLDITIFIADTRGQRVIQREALPPRMVDGAMQITSGDAGEEWRFTDTGELTIIRTITVKSRPVQQRLVLARASELQ
jgi:hypothetical protein